MMVDIFFNLFGTYMDNYVCKKTDAVEYLFIIKKK